MKNSDLSTMKQTIPRSGSTAINELFRKTLKFTIYFTLPLLVLFLCSSNNRATISAVIAVLLITAVSYVVDYRNALSFSLLFCLGISFWTDVLIHYLDISVDIRIKAICLIPIAIKLLRSNLKTKRVSVISLILPLALIANVIAAVSESTFSASGYIYSFTPVLVFSLLSIEDESSHQLKSTFIYVYIVSLLITTVQSLANLNVDTRNGLFGVYGQASYYLFVLLAPIYALSRYIYGQEKINTVALYTICSAYVYLMTEAKSFLFILLALEICCFVFSRRVNLKNVFAVCLLALCFPAALSLLVTIYPKFGFLNLDTIISTLLDEKARTGFMFTRFESLQVVLSNVDASRLIIGSGMGSYSIPDNMLMIAHGLLEYMPQYMRHYGFYHGYVQSTVSVALLEGGIFLIFCIMAIWLRNTLQILRSIQYNCMDASIGLFLLVVHFAILYQLLYSNIFSYNSLLLLGVMHMLTNKYLNLRNDALHTKKDNANDIYLHTCI